MKCIYPVKAKAVVSLESAFKPLKGHTPFVPCGRCMPCRMNKARTWAIRIMHETRSWESSLFVTFTYKPECLPQNGTLVKHHVQDFFKRLRKRLNREIKYFVGGEYGEIGGRPHYHAVIFGVSRADVPAIESSWPDGFVHVGDVSFDSACYVASYTLKKLTGPKEWIYEERGVIPEFSLMSRRPGIGASYCERNQRFLKDNVFCVVKGKKVALPRYYRDKLFTDLEMEQMKEKFKDVNDEAFRKAKAAAGVEEGYAVLDYQRGQYAQAAVDAKARQGLKRRKL